MKKLEEGDEVLLKDSPHKRGRVVGKWTVTEKGEPKKTLIIVSFPGINITTDRGNLSYIPPKEEEWRTFMKTVCPYWHECDGKESPEDCLECRLKATREICSLSSLPLIELVKNLGIAVLISETFLEEDRVDLIKKLWEVSLDAEQSNPSET